MTSREECRALDEADPLRRFRDRFHLPEGMIYLDGNSLGPLPVAWKDSLGRTIEVEWREGLVTSWNAAGWWLLPETLGERMARLLGAGHGQTVVADGTSVSIFKAVQSARSLVPNRPVVVSEAAGFPTDLYVLEGATGGAAGEGTRRLIGRDGPDLASLLDDEVGVVLLSHVDYRTGALADIRGITRQIHAAGAIAIWDLCHSAGVVPLMLDEWNVDFAVGCTYKYLNAGPGAPSFLYVAGRHQERARQPLTGWWGHADPFAFVPDYRPAPGIRRFLAGSQSILGLKGVEAGLDAMEGADIRAIRRKSQRLTGLFMERVGELCGDSVEIVTPRDPEARGSQVALRHPEGYAIVQALIARDIVGDYRDPGIMRFGFAPLYLRHIDAFDAAEGLAECLAQQVWRVDRYSRRAIVT